MALATFVYELLAATPPVDVAPITESLHDAWLREEDVRQLEHRLGVLGGQHTQARAAEAELRAEAARLQELYDGLHSRISVRVAFALARAAGPLLRSVRGSLPG